MKKFFSLVLALVMVLSLTTVAFGAGPTTYPVASYADLTTALTNAVAGDTIQLTTDVNCSTSTEGTIVIDSAITLDLNGNTLTLSPVYNGSSAGANNWGRELSIVVSANATITGGTIKRGTSATGGSMVKVSGTDVTLTLDGVTLDGNNILVKHGGDTSNRVAVLVEDGATLIVKNSTLKNNIAEGSYGAAIHASGAKKVVLSDNTTITKNTTTNKGGAAMYAEAVETVEIKSTTITENTTYQNGTVQIDGCGSFVFDAASVISNNEAAQAGGIHITNTNSTIAGTIKDNDATGGNGGGLYTFLSDTTKTVTIESTAVIENNTASAAGGGLYVNSGNGTAVGQVTMNGGTISGNTANGTPAAGTLKDGGGDDLYVARGAMEINDGTIGAAGTTNDITVSRATATNGGKLTINGGTINGEIKVGATSSAGTTPAATVAVTGGTFSEDVSEYLADGLNLISDGAGGLVAIAKTSGSTTANTIKKDGYSLVSMDNTVSQAIAADFTKTVISPKVVTEGTKTTTTYYADRYVIDGTVCWACDATIADAKLVKDGVVVAFLTADTGVGAGTSLVATSYVEAKAAADRVCGDYNVDTYVVGGKNYAVGTAQYAVYNGKFVGIAAAASTDKVNHTFTTKLTYNAKGEVVAVKCDTCKKDFTVVKSNKVPATYAGEVKALTVNGTSYAILLGSSASSTAVTSPKTFDAGIALYAGMALMSAAGSAVVISKKKEF